VCHMRRRIHVFVRVVRTSTCECISIPFVYTCVSYEEEDTCVNAYAYTLRIYMLENTDMHIRGPIYAN
jgi:hypothetical protein